MPNWCSNYVDFSGSAENLEKLNADLKAAIEKATEGFMLECVGKPNDGYFFDAYMGEDEYKVGDTSLNFQFESKWSPCMESMVKIAEFYSVGFTYEYQETGCMVFGKAFYSQENGLEDIWLTDDEYLRCKPKDDNYNSYIFEGREYESEREPLEQILEEKINSVRGLKRSSENEQLPTIATCQSYVMTLSSEGNPDFKQFAPISESLIVTGHTLQEMVDHAVKYRDENDLGSGNWTDPIIYHPTKGDIAYISYNGRVWKGPKYTGKNIPIEGEDLLRRLTDEV